MQKKVTSAVIPAAGRGNRMYPLTKSVPKELLPLVDRPVILTVIEEGSRAGIETFHIVTSPKKPALREFFTPKVEDDPRNPRGFPMPPVNFVTQDEAKGLGHAVLQAREVVGDNPFVVQLPDDVFHEEDPLLQTMLKVHEKTGGCVVGLLEVSPKEIGAYSTTAIEREVLPSEITGGHSVYRLSQIVEKPTPEQVHSPYAIMGRYVLTSQIFQVLAETKPGRNGEIQLTDALATLADLPVEDGGGVWGVVSRGRHFDTGNLAGYLAAQAELALEHPFLGNPLREHLRGVICEENSGGKRAGGEA
ncbi:MAG: UTP--glucose-1-phosphate uridylyltransferase [Mobiluncus porci]|uniref:UTP--glucose-1-phosphate uridylyltransferase n=1 Tax=Mobiluncus porci TaxID=2652278 RepID=UPI0023F0A4C9|nr:UTP--glucose-1-phosphate uridylyltransferase [Mobiluncus porci]MDD7541366.1 UTP--glucose-1-phosphate uridylyltransferase [Mobiluncus porci]MDY5747849.1 UTP--glucose-1-phosphate uridylyltransferase [Mobiluncus porci]